MEELKGYIVTQRKENGKATVMLADNNSLELTGLTLPQLLSSDPFAATRNLCVHKSKADKTHEIWVISRPVDEQPNNPKTIKKLKELNEALKLSLNEAQEAIKAKNAFLSGMSHDIRTPMNAIVGLTTIGISHIDEKPRVLDCLQKISIASAHLMSLVNDVLDMSRIDSGRLVLNEDNFSLANITHDIAVILRPQAIAKNQELRIEPKDIYEENLIGDSLRLRQILVNIVGNAIKYTPIGGKITVKLSQFFKAKDLKGSDTVWLDFVCEDNGIGMSREFVNRIFIPFERDKTSATEKIEGTGLGMAIVKNIIDRMNGTIEVESEIGKGSRFSVNLPFTISKKPNIKRRIPSNNNVLVVESKASSASQISRYLVESGFSPITVTSGIKAVTRITENVYENHMPCLMILGQEIEDMSALELASHIRQPAGDSLPIILVSEDDWSNIEYAATRSGINAFVPCPIFKSKLIETVFEMINKDSLQNNSDSSRSNYGERRILLVDDLEINREIVTEMLFFTGIKIDSAENGVDALEKFKASSIGYYDMILMDVKMPIMNGYEATKAIRALNREDSKRICIVAMTADAFVEDVRMAKEAGMDEHCSKPVDFQKLMEIIKNRFDS